MPTHIEVRNGQRWMVTPGMADEPMGPDVTTPAAGSSTGGRSPWTSALKRVSDILFTPESAALGASMFLGPEAGLMAKMGIPAAAAGVTEAAKEHLHGQDVNPIKVGVRSAANAVPGAFTSGVRVASKAPFIGPMIEELGSVLGMAPRNAAASRLAAPTGDAIENLSLNGRPLVSRASQDELTQQWADLTNKLGSATGSARATLTDQLRHVTDALDRATFHLNTRSPVSSTVAGAKSMLGDAGLAVTDATDAARNMASSASQSIQRKLAAILAAASSAKETMFPSEGQ